MSRTSGILARLLQNRTLVRAPIWLYRAHLGFLLGQRLLLLEHIGRKTGARRYAVLEVVEQPAPDEYVIVSGFGARAQWYRNVLANPHVRVSVGRMRNVPAVATPMTRDAAKDALERYAERYPKTWARIEPTLEAALQTPELDLPMLTLKLARG
ncbi:nitroreductase family deazaflavin-dependent oxidoreductase [Mycolicibacterium sp. 120270]|uniref:nitroreductase family deazaflavin-dependent oxidoreductase n=1 Tax=Mycolicibacterium sp. 120270 TaxID=3090600 RepID=UPI00299D95EC|nr:nitroreductase family deazaflavin-dependent oxidoreductase [Mycolicibacterium sp. 120270]MDX1886712.1 nitroreductase family deazaflavin-dependent oxidoreductase [Mycolicibacterium sp. 120270]